MRILVIDVACEGGGALSVFNKFIDRFKADVANEYIVCVGTLDYDDVANVKFVKIPWVKKSYLHRLFFDSCYIKKIVKKYRPEKIFSLQNKGVNVRNVQQEVFFHNALFICEKRFSFKESKLMWLYQNVISTFTKRSLKKVDRIFVQAEWIKINMSRKWKINLEKIVVDAPDVNDIFKHPINPVDTNNVSNLFFPAEFYAYKNHLTLLTVCVKLWNSGYRFTLSLTGTPEMLNGECKNIVESEKYPIILLGKLSIEEMRNMYAKSVLVFPSYIETVGLPLIEARSMGVPIISADCEYAHESIGQYDRVAYFQPFDIEALERAIMKALCLTESKER